MPSYKKYSDTKLLNCLRLKENIIQQTLGEYGANSIHDYGHILPDDFFDQLSEHYSQKTKNNVTKTFESDIQKLQQTLIHKYDPEFRINPDNDVGIYEGSTAHAVKTFNLRIAECASYARLYYHASTENLDNNYLTASACKEFLIRLKGMLNDDCTVNDEYNNMAAVLFGIIILEDQSQQENKERIAPFIDDQLAYFDQLINNRKKSLIIPMRSLIRAFLELIVNKTKEPIVKQFGEISVTKNHTIRYCQNVQYFDISLSSIGKTIETVLRYDAKMQLLSRDVVYSIPLGFDRENDNLSKLIRDEILFYKSQNN